MQIKIKENSWVAKIATIKMKADAVAMVFGNTIHIYGVSRNAFLQDDRWVRHELEHVLQYQKLGKFYFLIKYLFYSIKFGYFNNPLEKEARIAETNIELNKQIKIIN